MNKVRGGTPDHSEDLCRSCAYSSFRRGFTLQQEDKYCSHFEETVRYPVAECTAYRNRELQRSGEFYKTAWVLIPDPDGQLVGIAPQEFSRRQRKGEIS